MKKNTISNTIKYYLSLSLLISLATNAAAQIYVKHDATGANDGTSWANAYTDLQAAIDAQSASIEIWVATGTYYPTQGFGSDVREKTFYISKDGLPIYGGFVGTETTLSQRNPTTNTTILSGDLGTLNDNTDNSYHVIHFDGTTVNGSITNSTILDGFTIQNGNADGTAPLSYGGGMYLQADVSTTICSPTISNCIMDSNNAVFGGGMFSNPTNSGTTNPEIINCIFKNNTSTAHGAAIYSFGETSGTSSPRIINSLFYNNQSAIKGGAISATGASGIGNPSIINCTFSNNTGAGVIHNYGASCTMSMVNTIIWDNTGGNIVNEVGATATFNYGIYNDGQVNGTVIFPSGTTGNNNLDGNPLFMDAANGDYSLNICTPAVNAGDNTSGSSVNTQPTDLAGNTRFYNSTTIDIGAYELNRIRRAYVNHAATGNNDGTSWADAYTDLQSALNYQCEGLEIWIAAGTYTPTLEYETGNTPLETRDRTFYFNTDNIKIYGGFAGTETMLSERNHATNSTIIDANGYYHAIYLNANISNNFVIDGLTIKNGNANGTSGAASGGAIYLKGQHSASNPTISNCIFENNSAVNGGACYLAGASGSTLPIFTNCLFFNNSATDKGGAIFGEGSTGDASATFINCTFSNNTATTSGDVYYGSNHAGVTNPTFTNCILWSNGSTPIASLNASSGTINYSIYDDGTADGSAVLPSSYTGNNNLDSSPSFADAANNNYSLKQSSIAIDNGDAISGSSANTQTTDLAGNARFYNTSKIDVGAYEFQGAFVLPVELILLQRRKSRQC